MEVISGSQDPLFIHNTPDSHHAYVNAGLQLDGSTSTIAQSSVKSCSTITEDTEDLQAKQSDKSASSRGCCSSCLRSHSDLPDNPTTIQRIKYAFSCPPHGKIGDCLIWIVLCLALWGCLISITWEMALPGGKLFSLLLLYVMALLAGLMADFVGLPSLLGNLVMGILFSSIPGINALGHNIDIYYSSVLRNIALTIILIRAGLGLDPVALKKLSCTVLRLAFLPCLVETVTMGIASAFFLDLPWSWSLMLGFVVAAVSPAVVVPSLLRLSEEGYGVDQGIPTLVIAAASIDDVLAITGFSIMLGLTFAKGALIWTILEGPTGMVLGILCGIVFAILCWYLPYKEKTNRSTYKFVIIFSLSALAIFGSHRAELESSGPILVLTLAFVAGLGWRKLGTEDPEVCANYRFMWEIFQPILFASIGSEIDIGATDPGTIGWGMLALLIGVAFRIATSFVVVMGASLTAWERLFIAIAWLPKATVQAAIGSQALDHVLQHGGDDIDHIRGQQVVTLAVMAILLTAPLGAVAVRFAGPRLLAKCQPKP
ncbi:sodium/hydrogen exchanger 9B2-like isoform X2 [Cherax quadricarinatus]|uniref:sodium/hydrogen exchanger 9B2-like isoform X2 n=1 Tax=Cherax quadricarinatus TaxID=27406 RepID=UPI00387ECFF3